MKKLMGLVVTLVLAAAGLGQQTRIFTRPVPPTRDILDRLSLTEAWRIKIPTQGQRDGLYSVQLIPGTDGQQMVVQTFSGAVTLLDAETGDTLWRTPVGIPYWDAQPVAYNANSIFATRRDYLHVLNRVDGSERVYTVDKDSKLPNYGYRLISAPSSAPVADERTIVFCLENRVTAYDIPNYGLVVTTKKEKAKDSEPDPEEAAKEREALQPELMWNYLTADLHFERAPLLTAGQVGAVASNGTFLSLNKFELKEGPRYDYQFNKDVSAGMGQHGNIAYIGCEDYTLYALNMVSGKLLWRYLSGSPIRRQPAVTDQDVFVTPFRRGLARVDRESGREKWRNHKAEQFLAGNQKFVYASDRIGRLLVLDRAKGVLMAHYDMSEFLVPVTNEWTDRIYFANHDGQILCLHHRDNLRPLPAKRVEAKKPPVKPKEEKKPPPEPEPKEPKDPNDQVKRSHNRLQIADCRLQIERIGRTTSPRWERRLRKDERMPFLWQSAMSNRPSAENLQSAICNLQFSKVP